MRSPKKVITAAGDERWRVRYRRGDTQTSQPFDTEAEALKFCIDLDEYGAARAEQMLYDRLAGGADSTVPTVTEWVHTYLETLSVTRGTREKYLSNYARHIAPRVGTLPVTHLSHDDAALLVRHLSETKGLSDKTVANVFTILASAMDAAHKRGVVSANPCAEVTRPRRTAHLLRSETYLSQTEFLRLRGNFNAHFLPLLDFAVGTGARWGECAALTVRDIDYRAMTVRINKAVKNASGAREVGPTKTRHSNRTVTLPPEIVPSLLVATQDKAPNDLAFTMPKGGPLLHRTFSTRYWIAACEKAGLTDPRPTFHWLRHSHASWLIQDGEDMLAVSRRLGHSSYQVTADVYGHLDPRAQADAAGVAGRVFRSMGALAIEPSGERTA